MKKTRIKLIINWIGLGIGVIGLVFVIRKIIQYSDQIDLQNISLLSWTGLTALIFTYGLSNLLLAFAWRKILQFLGVNTKPYLAVQIFGISQIGKYVPGNIFQFAGRQALGQADHIPGAPLIKSSLWEIGLLAFTGAFFSIIILPVYITNISLVLSFSIFILVLGFSILGVNYWIGKNIGLQLASILHSFFFPE